MRAPSGHGCGSLGCSARRAYVGEHSHMRSAVVRHIARTACARGTCRQPLHVQRWGAGGEGGEGAAIRAEARPLTGSPVLNHHPPMRPLQAVAPLSRPPAPLLGVGRLRPRGQRQESRRAMDACRPDPSCMRYLDAATRRMHRPDHCRDGLRAARCSWLTGGISHAVISHRSFVCVGWVSTRGRDPRLHEPPPASPMSVHPDARRLEPPSSGACTSPAADSPSPELPSRRRRRAASRRCVSHRMPAA